MKPITYCIHSLHYVLLPLVLLLVSVSTTHAADWDILCTKTGCVSEGFSNELFLDNNVTSGNVYTRSVTIQNLTDEPISTNIRFHLGTVSPLADYVLVSVNDGIVKDAMLSDIFSKDIVLSSTPSHSIQTITFIMKVGDLPNSVQGAIVSFDITFTFEQNGTVLSDVSTQDTNDGLASVLGASILPETGVGNAVWFPIVLVLIGILFRYVLQRSQNECVMQID